MFALLRRRASESPSAPVVQTDRTRNDWTSQPVLERTSGDLELTAPTAQFLPGLAGRRRLDLALAPLGHDVRLEAPAGIATGIARAVETAPGRPPSNVRPSRRLRLSRRRVEPSPPGVARAPSADDSSADAEPPVPPEEPRVPHDALPFVPAEPAEPSAAAAPRELEPYGPDSPLEASAPATPRVSEAPLRVLRAAASATPLSRPLLVSPPVPVTPEPVAVEIPSLAMPPLPAAEAPASSPAATPPPARASTRVVRRRAGLGPPLSAGAAGPALRVSRASEAPPEASLPEAADGAATATPSHADVPAPEVEADSGASATAPTRDDPPTQPSAGAPLVGDAQVARSHATADARDVEAVPAAEAAPREPEPRVLRRSADEEALPGEAGMPPLAPAAEPVARETVSPTPAPGPSSAQVVPTPSAGTKPKDVAPKAASGTTIQRTTAPETTAEHAPPEPVEQPERIAPTTGLPTTATLSQTVLPELQGGALGEGTPTLARLARSRATEDARDVAQVQAVETASREPELPALRASAAKDAPQTELWLPPLVHPAKADPHDVVSPARAAAPKLVARALAPPEAKDAAPKAGSNWRVQRTRSVTTTPVRTPPEIPDPPERIAPTTGRTTVSTMSLSKEAGAAFEITRPDLAPPTGDAVAKAIEPAPSEVPSIARAAAAPVGASRPPRYLTPTPATAPGAQRRLPVARLASAPPPASPSIARLVPRNAASTVADSHPQRTHFASAVAAVQRVATDGFANALASATAETAASIQPTQFEPAPVSGAPELQSVQSVQPEAASATAPAAAPAGAQSPEGLDELAGRLYDRIRARLRDELLIDRERAGLLTDIR